MNIAAKIFPFVDHVYDYFVIKRNCSVQLTDDLFDEKKYSIEGFYNNVKPCFDKPELFYTTLNPPGEANITRLPGSLNGESFFAYPSPVETKWQENNKAFFKLFSNGKSAETLLLFAP